MICNNCNAAIPDAAVFCPACGKKAGEKVESNPVSKKCLQCGAENPLEAKFCRVDGWQFPQPEPGSAAKQQSLQENQGERICPTCGTSNPAGAQFCRNDGSPLDQAAHASLTPEPGVEEKAGEQVKAETENAVTELESGMKPAAEQESRGERVVCPTCGTLNAPGARFCKNDATPLDSVDQAVVRPETAVQEKMVEQTTIVPEKETLKTNATEAGAQRSWLSLAVVLAVLCVAAIVVYWLFTRTPVDRAPKPLPGSVVAVPGGEPPGAMPESAVVAPGAQTSQQLPENTVAAPVVETPQQIPDNNVAAPTVDLPRLEGQINRALRAAGIDGVTAQVNDAAVVTLKGVVKGAQDRQKALEIVKTFKEISQVNDIIFIIEK